MKIALIGTTAACVLGFRADLIRALVENGHSVYAFALDYDSASRESVKALGGIPVDYHISRAGLNPFNDLIATLKLSRIIRSIGPDMVFSYFAKPVIFGTFAAVLAGVKRRVGMLEGLGYVFTELSEGMGFKRKLLKWVQVQLYRLSFPFLERLILLNKDDQIDLVDKYKLRVKKVSVLGGIGLKLADYPYSTPSVSPVSFIFVGRLLAEKGVHFFIAAARIVKAQFPDSRFVMLGGIDESNPGGLKARDLDQLKMEGVIEHPGHVSDVVGWVSSASVFVLPSYYREGVPRSTQEAMAIGRAILTTDVPGCKDTVVDGKNGFLVAPWSAEDLAEKMIHLIKRPDDIVQMGLASYAMAQDKFDAGVVNQRLMSYLV
jgi:glycosyltransferase involved in cell wall biosynthesis